MSKQSIQLARFNGWESVTVGAKKLPAVKLKYTRLDGDTPQDMELQYLLGSLPKESGEVLQATKVGDEFVLVKEEGKPYTNAKGITVTPWNLKEIRNAATFVAKEKKAFTPYNKAEKKEYDTTGIKVGAARNQAIALLVGLDKTLFSNTVDRNIVLNIVDEWAYEIIKRQQVQEDNVRNKTEPVSVATSEDVHNLAQQQQQQNQDQYHDAGDEIPF